jgi:hypothetical protein
MDWLNLLQTQRHTKLDLWILPLRQAFRRILAEKNKCDATCPVSTSIFLRIVAEYTWEEFNSSSSIQGLAPFWRVVESSSPMAKKLNFDSAWIDLQRELEKQNSQQR